MDESVQEMNVIYEGELISNKVRCTCTYMAVSERH